MQPRCGTERHGAGTELHGAAPWTIRGAIVGTLRSCSGRHQEMHQVSTTEPLKRELELLCGVALEPDCKPQHRTGSEAQMLVRLMLRSFNSSAALPPACLGFESSASDSGGASIAAVQVPPSLSIEILLPSLPIPPSRSLPSSLTNGNSAALLIAALTASHCLQVCAVLQCCVMCLLQNSVQNSLCLQIVFAMLNSVYTCFGMQTVQTVFAMRCR